MKPNMAAAQFAVSQKKNLAGCVLTMTMLQEEFVGYFAQIAIVGLGYWGTVSICYKKQKTI